MHSTGPLHASSMQPLTLTWLAPLRGSANHRCYQVMWVLAHKALSKPHGQHLCLALERQVSSLGSSSTLQEHLAKPGPAGSGCWHGVSDPFMQIQLLVVPCHAPLSKLLNLLCERSHSIVKGFLQAMADKPGRCWVITWKDAGMKQVTSSTPPLVSEMVWVHSLKII